MGDLISQRKFSQQGFTLLEVATVLFLIALLLGSMQLGNDLINAGHIKGLVSDFQNVSRMMNLYQDKFHALPGDDAIAESHLGAIATHGNGNSVIEGNWYDEGATSETSRVWQHFRLAGLMGGGADLAAPDYTPRTSLGTVMGLQAGGSDPEKSPIKDAHGSALTGSVITCARRIPGKLVLRLDIKMDDGNPATGSMLATLETGVGYRLGAMPSTLGTQTLSDLQPDQLYIACVGG